MSSMDITDWNNWLDDDPESSGSQDTSLTLGTNKEINDDPKSQIWLLPLFIDGKDIAKVVHVNAKARNTDFSLFCGLREKYYLVSSALARFFKLHQVSALHVVRVSGGKGREIITQGLANISSSLI